MRGTTKAWRRLQDRYEAIVAQGKAPVIVDAGANIGTASVWFKQQYPEAAVVAIEPDPGNAAVLRMNTAGLDNVHVMEAAIGASQASCRSSPKVWVGRADRTRASGIPIVTVDNAVAQVPTGCPSSPRSTSKVSRKIFSRTMSAGSRAWPPSSLEPHDWMLPGRVY